MAQHPRTLTRSLTVLLLAIAIAPATANAWPPLSKLFHMHPRAVQSKDARITFHLCNNDGFMQQVKVNGQVYTLTPHGSLTIKADAGTEVYAVTAGIKHRPGDLLVAVKPQIEDDTITIE